LTRHDTILHAAQVTNARFYVVSDTNNNNNNNNKQTNKHNNNNNKQTNKQQQQQLSQASVSRGVRTYSGELIVSERCICYYARLFGSELSYKAYYTNITGVNHTDGAMSVTTRDAGILLLFDCLCVIDCCVQI
jgi:hypothetical protein